MTGTTASRGTHPPRRRPGRPKGGAILADRAQLLAAAERAIASIGPDATMDQIAAEAAVTKPILYRTVGDKAAVVEALSDVLADRIARSISASIVPSGAPRDGFAASIRAYLVAVAADRNLYLFVNSTPQRAAPLRARIDRSARQLVDMFVSASGVEASASAALTWGHSIIGSLQVVALMWLDEERCDDAGNRIARDVDDVAGDVTHLLWPGVAAILGLDSSALSRLGPEPQRASD